MILGDGNRTSRLATIRTSTGRHYPKTGFRVNSTDHNLRTLDILTGLVH
jgi:hypothetical protein